MKQNNCRERGHSLLELLVATVLAAPLLLLFLRAAHMLVSISATLHTRRTELTGEMAYIRGIEQVMRDVDTHPFPLLPRIHRGELTYADGTRQQLAVFGRQSVGITSARLRMRQILRLEHSASGTFRACPALRSSVALLSDGPLRSVLLLAPDGLYEVRVHSISRTIQSCYAVQFTIPARSMITSIPEARSLQYSRYAVPIEWIQTLIRDRNGVLRVLRHSGSSIYLQQPVEEVAPLLTLALHTTEIPGHYELELQGENVPAMYFHHHVPRTDYRHILWNLNNAAAE